jgi:DNA-binding NarL/FixJ family response regulator
MTRILIADDHESMRAALKATVRLHPHWEICGEATDGREAIEKAEELRPDIVILDFKMPIANGLKAGSEIVCLAPDTPILMYTLYKTRELEMAAKLVGIRQVLAKEDGAFHLLNAIERELVTKNENFERAS